MYALVVVRNMRNRFQPEFAAADLHSAHDIEQYGGMAAVLKVFVEESVLEGLTAADVIDTLCRIRCNASVITVDDMRPVAIGEYDN